MVNKIEDIDDYLPLSINDNYCISKNGNVYSYYTNKILKQRNNKKGYPSVHLTINGKGISKVVHRLVAKTFIPNPYNLPQVNHIDGNKENNSVENLEWCTNEYNMRHSWEMGLREPLKGNEIGTSKLLEHEVIEIYESEENSYNLSKKHNISISSVNLIRSDKIWKHVTENKTKGRQPLNNFRNNKFSLEEVCDIYEQDGKNKDIAYAYNVPESTIKSIRNGNSYKDITKNLKKGKNTNRLTKDEVEYIYLTKDSVNQIKSKISVSESTISGIKNSKSYKNITKYLNKEDNNGLYKL